MSKRDPIKSALFEASPERKKAKHEAYLRHREAKLKYHYKRKQAIKERRKIDPDFDAQYREKNRRYGRQVKLQRDFGLTIEQYNELLKLQNYACAICKIPHAEKVGRRLQVDHNHETSKIRGLLCINCNPGLGKFKDSPTLLRLAAEYLEK